jgi:hypothetical protein
MRTSSVVAASAALVAGANAFGNATYVTEVVTAYTTFCPTPTEVVHGTNTYTVTKATTLVITDCPCTVTKPVITKPVVPAPSSVVPKPEESSVPAVHATSEAEVPVVHTSTEVISASNPVATVPVPTGAPSAPPQAPSAPPQAPLSPPTFHNSTVGVPPVGTGTAPPVGGATTTGQPPVFTGAATKAVAASGAGLIGVLGLFAFVL